MQNFDCVQTAFNELVNEGKIFPSADQKIVEQHKALLTRRAAYYLNLKNQNWGLLEKTSGNNVDGLSVDIVLNRLTAEYADIATDREVSAGKRQAFPVNGTVKVDSSLVPHWILPSRGLAGFDSTPVTEPTQEQDTVLAALDALVRRVVQEELAKLTTSLSSQMSNIQFPEYEGSIKLGSFLGTARIVLTPVTKKKEG